MSKDKVLLLSFWVGTVGILLTLIPKNKIRNAMVAFFYKQLVTWLFGLLVVEKGLIKYPVRLFKKANKTSFSFEYFFYPVLCAVFNLHYPENKNKLIKFLYYLLNIGFITLVEFFAERYTNLIKYIKWKWYWSFITLWLTNYSSRLFYRWFFKDEFKFVLHSKLKNTGVME